MGEPGGAARPALLKPSVLVLGPARRLSPSAQSAGPLASVTVADCVASADVTQPTWAR